MAYPSLYQRLSNFVRDANTGVLVPQPAKLDSEFNGIQLSLSQQRDALKAITSADGRLQNVASALAAALVGTWAGTGAGVVTFVTTIPYQPAFSVNSVLILLGAVPQRPAQITSVQNSAGFLSVTMVLAPTVGAALTVWAFEPGAGLLTRLASTAQGDGAALIGLEDALGQLSAGTVEDAIAELASGLTALITGLGNLADYFKRTGSVVATGDFDMGGFKVGDAADGTLAGDYVTLRQMSSYVAIWNDLSRFFLKRDGSNAMAGAMNFGNQKGINLADPDLAAPLDAVNVRSMLRTISTSGASPVGVVVDFIGVLPPSNWLMCDGSAYLSTAFPLLDSILDSSYKTGKAQGAQVASYPALVAGNLTAGVLTLLPALQPGVGYIAIPYIDVLNTDGGAAVTAQPTWTVGLSAAVIDGPNVTGGVLTIALATGGTGIRAGAVIRVFSISAATYGGANLTSLALLPAGYFKTPDFRGRVSVGAGTESKSPGIIDPPDLSKGDTYNATLYAIGQYGGEQAHRLTVPELPDHTHLFTGGSGDTGDPGPVITTDSAPYGYGTVDNLQHTGADVSHNTVQPYHVLNKIIKAA